MARLDTGALVFNMQCALAPDLKLHGIKAVGVSISYETSKAHAIAFAVG